MEPITTAATAQGSLSAVGTSIASVGGSLAKVGASSIAFAATHPATIGFVAGLATYFVVSKTFRKRKPVFQPEHQAAQA